MRSETTNESFCPFGRDVTTKLPRLHCRTSPLPVTAESKSVPHGHWAAPGPCLLGFSSSASTRWLTSLALPHRGSREPRGSAPPGPQPVNPRPQERRETASQGRRHSRGDSCVLTPPWHVGSHSDSPRAKGLPISDHTARCSLRTCLSQHKPCPSLPTPGSWESGEPQHHLRSHRCTAAPGLTTLTWRWLFGSRCHHAKRRWRSLLPGLRWAVVGAHHPEPLRNVSASSCALIATTDRRDPH